MAAKLLQFDFKSFWRDLRALRFLRKYANIESKNFVVLQKRLMECGFPSTLVQDLGTAYLIKKEQLALNDLFRLGLGLLHSKYSAPADFLFGRILDVRTDIIYDDSVLVFTIQKYVAPIAEVFHACEIISPPAVFVQILSQCHCLTSKSIFKDTVGLWVSGSLAGYAKPRIRYILLHDTIIQRNQRYWKIRNGVLLCPICKKKHMPKKTPEDCPMVAIPTDLGASALW